MGDGVLNYFGYPAAHDDAERAVRAGLALIDAVVALAGLGCAAARSVESKSAMNGAGSLPIIPCFPQLGKLCIPPAAPHRHK
jgi:hypothetical protein